MVFNNSVSYIEPNQILAVSFIVRILVVLVIWLLPIDPNIKVILIFLTDFLDCWTTKLISKVQNGVPFTKNNSCKEFNYQMTDKIVDLLTYCIVLQILPFNPLFLGLLIIRSLGLTLFYRTRDSHWFIYMPDLFKEVVLFSIFFGQITPSVFIAIIIHKVIFEFIWHTYVNHKHYEEKKKLI